MSPIFPPPDIYQQFPTQIVDIPQEISDFLLNTPSGRALCDPDYHLRFNWGPNLNASEEDVYDNAQSTSSERSSSILTTPSSVGPFTSNQDTEMPLRFLNPAGLGATSQVVTTAPDLPVVSTPEYNVGANTVYEKLSTERMAILQDSSSNLDPVPSSSHFTEHCDEDPADDSRTIFSNYDTRAANSLYGGGPMVRNFAPLSNIAKGKQREGTSFTPLSISPERSHTKGMPESFGGVMPVHHLNLTNTNRMVQNGRASTEPTSSTPSYKREFENQNFTLNSVTRTGKRTHSDETVVENINSQQSSSQSRKKAKMAPVQEEKRDTTTPNLRSAEKKDLDGEDTLTLASMTGPAGPSNTSATKTGLALQPRRNGQKKKTGMRKASPNERIDPQISVTSPTTSYAAEASTTSLEFCIFVDPTAPKRRCAPNSKVQAKIPSKSALESDPVGSVDPAISATLSEGLLPINMHAIPYVPKEVVEARKKYNDEYSARVEADRRCGVETSPAHFVFRVEK